MATFQLLDPAYSAYFEDDDEDEEDPDARADPMYGLNLKQFLTEFLHDFCKQPYFPHFSQVRSIPLLINLRVKKDQNVGLFIPSNSTGPT